MISRYSLIVAVLIFCVSLCVIALLRRQMRFLIRYSTAAMVVLALLSALRLFIPLDFKFSYVINSYTVYPAIQSFLETDIFPGGYHLSLIRALAIVWVIGILIVLIRTVISLSRNARMRRNFLILPSPEVDAAVQELNLQNAEVIVSPQVQSPFVVGLFRAKIYLPATVQNTAHLKLILLHEYQHYRSHDILIKAFYLFLSTVFWWNPLIHMFQKELDCVLELRCDTAVTKGLSERDKVDYLTAMLAVYKTLGLSLEKMPLSSSCFVKADGADKTDFIVQRFQIILDKPKRRYAAARIISVILVVVFILSSYLVIIQPAYVPPTVEDSAPIEEPPPEDQVFEITSDSTHILYTDDGKYHVYIADEFAFEIPSELAEVEPFSDLEVIKESEGQQ